MSTTDTNKPKTFVGRLIAGIINLFHQVQPLVDDVVKWADNIVNVIKKAESSEAGQLLISGIETVWPASIPYLNGFKLWLPKTGAILANIEGFENLTDEEKLKAFLNYLKGLQTSDPVLYAGVLNTLSAAVQQFFTNNEGIELTVKQSLSVAQVVHDETLGVVQPA